MKGLSWFFACGVLLALLGCTRSKHSEPMGATQDFLPSGVRQIDFGRGQVRIGNEVLLVEVADRPEQLERGLMYRRTLDEGRGMLFIFKRSEQLSFWMKNTYVPLSIAFMDESKTIVDIQDMVPAQEGQHSFPVYISSVPALYALEVPRGWFQKRGVEVGHSLDWSLKQE